MEIPDIIAISFANVVKLDSVFFNNTCIKDFQRYISIIYRLVNITYGLEMLIGQASFPMLN